MQAGGCGFWACYNNNSRILNNIGFFTVCKKNCWQDRISWAFPKGSPYLEVFSAGLFKLKETGIIDRLIRTHLSGGVESSSCESSTFKPITQENIFTAFVLLVCGIVVSIAALCYEKIRFEVAKRPWKIKTNWNLKLPLFKHYFCSYHT